MTTSPVYLYDGDGLCFGKNKIGVVFDLYKDFKSLKEDIEVVKYYCDICGKEVFSKDDFYTLELSEGGAFSFHLRKDICKDCYNKILNIIKKKEEKNV